MKKNIIFLLTLLLAYSCTPSLFILKSTIKDPINISLSNKSKGKLKQNDSLLVWFRNSRSTKIIASNGSFNGSVEYTKALHNRKNKFNLIVSNISNAFEKSRKSIDYNDLYVQAYWIVFKESDKPKEVVKEVVTEPTSFGHIKLTSNEKEVEIYLDGEYLGKILGELPFNKKISTGNHQIMVRKEFYMPITIKFILKPEEVYAYNFELKPAKGWIEEQPGQATTIQARGNLTVVTEFSDYKVFIEGVEKMPPFELKNMPAGKYKLVVKCNDFTKELDIIVEDGKTKYIDLDLTYPRKK